MINDSISSSTNTNEVDWHSQSLFNVLHVLLSIFGKIFKLSHSIALASHIHTNQ